MTSNNNLFSQRSAARAGHLRSIVGFQRPNNATAYTAGDVINEETTASVIEFKGVGVSGCIKSALCIVGEIVTANLELYIFDAEPTNIGDNAAFALATDDTGKYVSVYDFADASKKAVGTIQFYDSTAHDPASYTSTGGSLFGLLVTRSGFTPSNNTAFAVCLHVEADK